MPEAPDVEIYTRRLARCTGQRIKHLMVHASRVHGAAPATLRKLSGGRLGTPRRHGKWLLVPVEDKTLALHFGMAGDLVIHEGDEPRGSRLDMELEDGRHVAYVSRRQLGHTRVVHGPEELVQERGLGPDVLDLDAAGFLQRLRQRRGMVKAALLDQSIVAGLGNEYTDEALFQARIHPRTPTGELADDDLRRLYRKARHVLLTAIRHPKAGSGGVDVQSLPESWLLPHRGGSCPRCGKELDVVEAGGRRGWACQSCAPP